MAAKSISMFDTVRVRKTNLTTKGELAGLVGVVYGETTPSSTGVDVIGDANDDYAICVHFEDIDRDLWFEADLLEFVDHGAGQTVDIAGKQWVRGADGEWIEQGSPAGLGKDRPWWKFW
jgi:hypothetical protein